MILEASFIGFQLSFTRQIAISSRFQALSICRQFVIASPPLLQKIRREIALIALIALFTLLSHIVTINADPEYPKRVDQTHSIASPVKIALDHRIVDVHLRAYDPLNSIYTPNLFIPGSGESDPLPI
jgi:hypothetical protein